MESVVEEIVKEYGDTGKANIITINLDKQENYPLGQEYGITSVPTIIFIDKNDVVFDAFVGYLSKEDVVEVFDKMGVK